MHYLEIVAELHRRYAGLPADSLRAARSGTRSRIKLWSIDHLATAADTSLAPMLEAALESMELEYGTIPEVRHFTAFIKESQRGIAR